MATADEIAKACEGTSAYTLSGGYAVHANGTRALFEPGKAQGKECRNKAGWVTRAVYTYADGSSLTFTYHAAHGSRLKVDRATIAA